MLGGSVIPKSEESCNVVMRKTMREEETGEYEWEVSSNHYWDLGNGLVTVLVCEAGKPRKVVPRSHYRSSAWDFLESAHVHGGDAIWKRVLCYVV